MHTDLATGAIPGFTKPGLPAHPAWIARRLEQRGESIQMRQIGYFAGDERPFADIFREYVALNEKMKEDINRRRQQGKKKVIA